MIRFTKAAIRKWLEKLLHVHDSPERTAAAYSLGVFFGFSPFLGFHTVLALAFAFVFNLNRVAVLLGVYSDLPWIMGPWYALTTAAGSVVLGVELTPGFVGQVHELFELSFWHGAFWRQLATLMRPLFWPYFVGSTFGAAVLAAIAYRVALAFVHGRQHLRHHHHGGTSTH